MKVFVVTEGFYDGYRIITATTNEALANAIAEKFNCEQDMEKARVEVFDNAEMFLQAAWRVRFEKDGSVFQVQNVSLSSANYEHIGECCFDEDDRGCVVVVADSEEEAVKAATEKRERFMREREYVI